MIMDKVTRILVVEDDMIIAANISLQLTNLGYEVTGIETRGEEAVLHAQVNTPDIILMDINLKGALDGIETTKIIQKNVRLKLRSGSRWPRKPVAMHSNNMKTANRRSTGTVRCKP